MAEPPVQVRAITGPDRPVVTWLVTEFWGSEIVAVHGTLFRPAELPGFLAQRAGRIVGLVTFDIDADTLEIVTLNAIERRTGVGTVLIEASVSHALRAGCRQIRLTTTNDNIDALRFYQRRGFRLTALRPGAVEAARREKPQIPHTGEYGIPLRDEIDLTLPLRYR